MKLRSLVFVFLAALAVASMGNPATAQAQASLLRLTVPFDFYFGNERLSAGSYTIERVHSTDVVRISDQGGHVVLALTNAAEAAPRDLRRSKVVFNRYGDTYFLSKVQWEEHPTARELPTAKAEVEIAKSISGKSVVGVSARR